MNDTKNILLAWSSTLTSIVATAATHELISAIVLPVIFFAIGKTIDVLVQLYLKGKKKQ